MTADNSLHNVLEIMYSLNSLHSFSRKIHLFSHLLMQPLMDVSYFTQINTEHAQMRASRGHQSYAAECKYLLWILCTALTDWTYKCFFPAEKKCETFSLSHCKVTKTTVLRHSITNGPTGFVVSINAFNHLSEMNTKAHVKGQIEEPTNESKSASKNQQTQNKDNLLQNN